MNAENQAAAQANPNSTPRTFRRLTTATGMAAAHAALAAVGLGERNGKRKPIVPTARSLKPSERGTQGLFTGEFIAPAAKRFARVASGSRVLPLKARKRILAKKLATR